MAHLYEVQAREYRDPKGCSKFLDVPTRTNVEAPDFQTFDAIWQIGRFKSRLGWPAGLSVIETARLRGAREFVAALVHQGDRRRKLASVPT